MENILNVMAAQLTESDVRLLKEIYEPTIVGVPLEDARRGLMVMPDGEIRSYGMANIPDAYSHEIGDLVYLSSRDCGLSWKKVYAPAGALGACGPPRSVLHQPGSVRLIITSVPFSLDPKSIVILSRAALLAE